MRRVVWKYFLRNDSSIEMPASSKVLSVGYQNGAVVLWAEVCSSLYREWRRFVCVPTGDELPVGREYLGTVSSPDGIVRHVYEVSP